MTRPKLSVLLASTCLLLAGASAMAASPQTEAFVTNARPNVNFLDRSSRLALDKGIPQLRAFAHREAEEQTIAANAFVAWVETHTGRGEAAALGGAGVAVVTAPVGSVLSDAGAGVAQVLSPLGPVGAVAAAPLVVAGGVTNGVGAVVDGTTGAVIPGAVVVAPGAVVVAPGAPLIGAGLLPAGREDLDRLMSLDGRQFASLYRSTQQDSLRQLATLYRDYMTSGDDPALRALASSELPKVRRLLEETDRL